MVSTMAVIARNKHTAQRNFLSRHHLMQTLPWLGDNFSNFRRCLLPEEKSRDMISVRMKFKSIFHLQDAEFTEDLNLRIMFSVRTSIHWYCTLLLLS